MPRFNVWAPTLETEDSHEPIDAGSALFAALKWAEEDDVYGVELATYEEIVIVHVRAHDGTVTLFEVTGEMVPKFAAKELTTPKG